MKKIITILIMLFIIMFVYELFSWVHGATGRSKDGCGGCHGNEDTGVTITSSSPSNFTTYPGFEIEITVTLTASTFYSWAGIDISLTSDYYAENDIGTLTPVSSNLKLYYGELTHNGPAQMQDGSVNFVFKWRAPDHTDDCYFRASGTANINDDDATSGDRWNFMDYKIIRVVEPPREITLTSPNGGENWCTETQYNITWSSEYVDNVKIEWSRDGGSSYPVELISGIPASSGSWKWNIPEELSGTRNMIRITDDSYPSIVDASENNFTIMNKTKITDQPNSFKKCAGDNIRFEVIGSGDNLSYQWRKNSEMIPNATNNFYTIDNIQENHLGLYDVIVSGDCGDPPTSSAAELSIHKPPKITIPPKSDTLCLGQVKFMKAYVENAQKVEWFKEGIHSAIETGNTYNIESITYDDEGSYFVIATNVCGIQDTSDIAFI